MVRNIIILRTHKIQIICYLKLRTFLRIVKHKMICSDIWNYRPYHHAGDKISVCTFVQLNTLLRNNRHTHYFYSIKLYCCQVHYPRRWRLASHCLPRINLELGISIIVSNCYYTIKTNRRSNFPNSKVKTTLPNLYCNVKLCYYNTPSYH